jgi:metal-responsive CopG/Arc/MetJ family transcriptional regulator
LSSRKIAVSISEPLFEQADELAERMRISRSRFYALALEMFIRQRKNQEMLEQLNRVCNENPPTYEDEHLLQEMQSRQRLLVEGEW